MSCSKYDLPADVVKITRFPWNSEMFTIPQEKANCFGEVLSAFGLY